MVYLKKTGLLILFIITCIISDAQQAAAIDSMKTQLSKSVEAKDKVFWLDILSRTLMNVDLVESEKYGKDLIAVAEESRDRTLMVKGYMSNGLRCSYFGGQKDYSSRAIGYYNKALEIAKQNKMEHEMGEVQLRLATVYLNIPDNEKALSLINQAFSLISTLDDDSLKAESHNAYGMLYQSRNEKTLSLRHFLNALRIAEETKINSLMRNCYLHLSGFYSEINDFDKAIDYYMKAYKQLDFMKEKNVPYQRVIDINSIGNLFSGKKNYDIAISHFERSIAMADSLKFSNLKIPGYISLLNQYLRLNQPAKALDYINSASGQTLQKFLSDFGFVAQIDEAYGIIYTNLNRYDSAEYHFKKAMPFFEQNNSENNRVGFYRQLGELYKKTGDNKKSIDYYLKVKDIGGRVNSLENVMVASKNLDTLYDRTGDYKLARIYNSVYFQYKDSSEKLNKENELAQIEALDEQQRQDRLILEKEQAKEKRNRVQYMAIILAIAILFIGLVMMGWFKVSAGTIRAIGFFAFLLFFEFIFLLFKKNIYGFTHGEPWKDLAFMIALAALLVPLHHWLEHKVIHFLTSHHMLKLRGIFSKKGNEKT